MIDKNGKIGGKINLIDLIILVIILAILAFAAFKVIRYTQQEPEVAVPVTISLFADSSADFVMSQLENGSSVWDSSADVVIGTLTDYEVRQHMSTMTVSDGTYVQVPTDGYSEADFVVSAEGSIDDYGVTIDGQLYGLGHTMTIYIGKCKVFVRVSGIEPQE